MKRHLRCRTWKGVWSSSPCPRDGTHGTCATGAELDRGATLVIYVSTFTESETDARAMCVGGFAGTFTAP